MKLFLKCLLTCVLLGVVSSFWSCQNVDQKDVFDLIGDTSWTSCDSVLVVLLDASGHPLDTLFNDSLSSISQLKSLSAAKYPGGKASVHISGRKSGGVCFDQTRSFDAAGGAVVVDTLKDPTAHPAKVVAAPESLLLYVGGSPQSLTASVKPDYADQAVSWALAGDGVVSLSTPSGSTNLVKVNPEKAGVTKITVRSKKDTAKYTDVQVRVLYAAAKEVSLNKDSLLLYQGGPGDSLRATVFPDGSDPKVEWKSDNEDVAKVDSIGNVKPAKAGQTYVRAVSPSSLKAASAYVQVRLDAPKLVVASAKGAAINVPIQFSAKATQEFGNLVMYKWDLDGDGVWDDSLPGPWSGASVDLPNQTGKYSKEGSFTAKFLVRDGEGNEGNASVTVDIGNQAPEMLSISADTTISIKDSIPLTARVRDADGKVAWCGWDYDGDGKYDDSLATADSSVEVVLGHRYRDAGNYLAVFKAVDDNGKARLDTVKVKVLLDAPTADAGADTTVLVGTTVNVHAKGSDKLGSIIKREIKIGAGSFIRLSQQDTTIPALSDPGEMQIVVRVTDDDSLTALDTMKVSVVLSANADLVNLTFSAGPLDPAFKSSIGYFSAHASFSDSNVTVTPTAKDPAARITVNAKSTASGSASEAVKIQVGANVNVFQIVVTAPDGTQRVYSVSVARDPSADATLSKLEPIGMTLKPAFAPTTVEYADTVPSTTTFITLKPTLAVGTSSLSVNDSAMASGTATYPLPLQIGDNLFNVKVVSQSGSVQTVYKVKVVRKALLVLTRSLGGKPSAVTDSGEVLTGAAVSISSPSATGYHFLKWTLMEGTSILADSTANPGSLILKSAKVKVEAEYVINKYAITAGAGPGGSIVPSGVISLDYQQNQTFAITPLAGYRITAVTADGADVTASASSGSYTFTSVSADHSISATFGKLYTLSTQVSGGGRISPSNVVIDAGKDTTFTLTANPGYRILSVKVDGVDAPAGLGGSYKFTAVGADHLLEATFVRVFALTSSAGGGGSILPTSVSVDSNGNQTFTITPSTGFRTNVLLDNGSDVTASLSAGAYDLKNIDKAHTLAATFLRQYTITVNATGGGTVTPGTSIVDSGSGKSFTIAANAGYRVQSISVDGTPVALTGTYSFQPLTANHTLSVVFIRTYTIKTSWTGLGTISPDSAVVDSGSDTTFTLTPSANYRVSAMVDGSAPLTPAATYTFTKVSASRTFSATFTRYYSMTAALGLGGGTVHPASANADSGSAYNFFFNPSPNYRFLSLSDNGTGVVPTSGDTEYTVTGVNKAHTLLVYYMRTYNLSVNVTGNGTVTPGGGTIDSAQSRTFTITPASGYRIQSMSVDGAAVTVAGSYSFTGIKADHSLSVVFVKTYTIKASWTGVGSITPDSAVVDSGSDTTFTISTSAGYHATSLSADGSPVTLGSSYKFTNVNSTHTLSAVFSRYYTVTGTVAYGSGTITPASAGIDSNGSQKFVFKPSANYRFWVLNDSISTLDTVHTDTAYTLTGIVKAHNLKAYFLKQVTLTVNVTGGGTVSPGTVVIDSGTSKTFTITPSANHRIKSMSVDGSPVTTASSYTFNGATVNHTLSVVFAQTYTIKSSWTGAGTITPDSAVVDSGSDTTFQINATANHRVYTLTVDGNSVTAATSYFFGNVTSTHTISATFIRYYNVTGNVKYGSGTISPIAGTVDSLGSQQVVFKPSTNYRLLALQDSTATVDTARADTSYSLTNVLKDHYMHAWFWHQYTLSASSAGNGTVTPTSAVLDSNGKDTVYLSPTSGYRWYSATDNSADSSKHIIGGKYTQGYYIINPWNANHTISFGFMKYYSMHGSASGIGSISLPDTTADNASNFTVTLTASSGGAAAATRLISLLDNGNESIASVTGTLQGTSTYTVSNVGAAHTFSATFQQYYVLTGSVPNGGGTSSFDTVRVAPGASQTFSFTANTGYYLSALTDNGTSVIGSISGSTTGTSTYSISGISAGHAVVATFTAQTYTLVLTSNIPFDANKRYTQPTVCIQVASGNPTCGTTARASVSYGTAVKIYADSVFTNPIGIISTKEPWQYWQNSDGSVYDSNNPLTITTLTSSLSLTAIYSTSSQQ